MGLDPKLVEDKVVYVVYNNYNSHNVFVLVSWELCSVGNDAYC